MRISLLLFLLIPVFSFSQKAESTPETQWWLGLKGGVNIASFQTSNAYNVLESDIGELSSNPAKTMGWHLGVEGDFDLFGLFELSVVPGLRKVGWGNEKAFQWSSSDGLDVYDLNLRSDYDLLFFELPLSVKFDFINRGAGGVKIKGNSKSKIHFGSGGGLIAFVQTGVFYNRLLNASINVTKDVSYGGVTTKELYEQGVSSSFLKNSYGWVLGGGVGYDFQSARVELGVAYKKSFHNMVNVNERFSQNKLVNDYYEVLSDMKISNLEFSLRLLFPFKFVYSGSFKKA